MRGDVMPKEKIDETSHVTLKVDGRTAGTNYKDANDAKEDAVNRLNEGAKKATITEVVELEKKKKR
jgi:hypothetical protein